MICSTLFSSFPSRTVNYSTKLRENTKEKDPRFVKYRFRSVPFGAVREMKAVVITTPGDPEVLQVQHVPEPIIKDDEVLLRVAASALNRADTFQRKGLYEPPSGETPYLGLECSGTIEALGRNVTRWKIGDQVVLDFRLSGTFLDLG